MGEIIDLESYRRRLKRKAARTHGSGNRRNPDQAGLRGDKPRAGGEPRFNEKGKVGPAGNTKVESSDPDTE